MHKTIYKALIVLISFSISTNLIGMDPKAIEQENLDQYYIYYSFDKQEPTTRAFTYMIESYQPCIQPFNFLESTNHPYNLTSKIFPLRLFLTDDFFNNPEFKLTANEQNDYSKYCFHFYTETKKTIKEVIEEKIQLFEQTPFPPYAWFNPLNNASFQVYAKELIDASIIVYDKETKKFSHGPNSWIVKRQKEKEAAVLAKFLEDKKDTVLNRVIANITRYTQLVETTYLISLQRH
jgi:hypothetical protein